MNDLDIVFPGPQWDLFRRHLLGPHPGPGGSDADEQLAFALAAPAPAPGPGSGPNGVRLTVRELLLAGPADLERRTPVAVAPTAEFVAAALSRCREEGWSLIEAHSHPFSHGPGTTFSGIDRASDRAKMPPVADLLPANARHATMVLGHGSLDAHHYDRATASIRPVRRILVVGAGDGRPPLTRITPSGALRPQGPPTPAEPPGRTRRRPWRSRHAYPDAPEAPAVPAEDSRHDRQLPLLGPETQRLLARTTVAIVGLGGLGSFTALECAHLGFGRLVLVDPDTVERSNLNRLLGATEADVGRPKVEVYADLLRAVAPDSTVEAVHDQILSDRALGPVRTADLLLGCVDSDGARLVLNQLAVQYVLPYLDAGSGTRIDAAHRVTHAGGQVQAVLPGLGCLECQGAINARRAAFDLAPPEVRTREIAHGYGTREPAPSVVFLNGVVASLLVARAVQLLSGALPAPGGDALPALTLYDLLAPSLTPVTATAAPTCPTCGPGGVTALADLSPLHDAGPTHAPAPPPAPAAAPAPAPAPAPAVPDARPVAVGEGPGGG
ncbi:HesA/MoeB/ThiF family protein [Kitasatospora sp. NPDC090308]|uniref:HesA/MoeB/ThiF family protein n=1 Tax=Kitasatospora sp. NPDC090308 TaxID=3364082 RepID=UPI0037F3E6ED